MSSLDPRLYVVFNREDAAVGVFPSHISDILRSGVPGVLLRAPYFSEQRFGALKTQEHDFAHFGIEHSQKPDFSTELTQAEFTRQLKP